MARFCFPNGAGLIAVAHKEAIYSYFCFCSNSCKSLNNFPSWKLPSGMKHGGSQCFTGLVNTRKVYLIGCTVIADGVEVTPFSVNILKRQKIRSNSVLAIKKDKKYQNENDFANTVFAIYDCNSMCK